MSTSRSTLHALIEALPEESLERALAALAAVSQDGAVDVDDEAGIRRGLADVAAGRLVSGDDAFARFDAVLASRRGSAA